MEKGRERERGGRERQTERGGWKEREMGRDRESEVEINLEGERGGRDRYREGV